MSNRIDGAQPSVEHWDLIERLGGPPEVARHLASRLGIEFTRNRVWNWRRRGIPHVHRQLLARWARKRKIKVPRGFIG